MLKLKIIHIVQDEKFSEGVISTWNRENRFTNRVVFLNKPTYRCKFLKNISSIEFVWRRTAIIDLLQGDYDVLFFHSLPSGLWKYFKWIPKNKTVVWWAWGYDIYSKQRGCEPLIQLQLYKEQSARIIKKQSWKSMAIEHLKSMAGDLYYNHVRERVLGRIDYFLSPVELEKELISKEHPVFRPKDFSLQFNNREFRMIEKKDLGIVLGNSSSLSNNHLDILQSLEKIGVKGHRVVIPLSYGDMDYKELVKRELSKGKFMHNNECILLEHYLTKEEYYQITDSCSFLISGAIRQQALGNIKHAFLTGKKVFMYSNSVLFSFFKSKGFHVYELENVCKEDFMKELSEDMAIENYLLMREWIESRRKVYENFVQECLGKKQAN